jgi:iron complex outermembrane recepter protein
MDIRMPVMDGFTATKIIRESKPDIPIIAQTAYADDLAKAVESSFTTDIIVFKQTFVFGISANNIFDTRYYDHLSTLKPLNYYNQGRNVSISLKIPFGIK